MVLAIYMWYYWLIYTLAVYRVIGLAYSLQIAPEFKASLLNYSLNFYFSATFIPELSDLIVSIGTIGTDTCLDIPRKSALGRFQMISAQAPICLFNCISGFIE